VQAPQKAYATEMPKAAIEAAEPNAILDIEHIGAHIDSLIDTLASC
jgi:chemotaxis response regulator CheB